MLLPSLLLLLLLLHMLLLLLLLLLCCSNFFPGGCCIGPDLLSDTAVNLSVYCSASQAASQTQVQPCTGAPTNCPCCLQLPSAGV